MQIDTAWKCASDGAGICPDEPLTAEGCAWAARRRDANLARPMPTSVLKIIIVRIIVNITISLPDFLEPVVDRVLKSAQARP